MNELTGMIDDACIRCRVAARHIARCNCRSYSRRTSALSRYSLRQKVKTVLRVSTYMHLLMHERVGLKHRRV